MDVGLLGVSLVYGNILKAALTAVFVLCSQSWAQPTALSPRSYIAIGDYDGARTALKQLVVGDPKAALHAAYLEALIRLHENDPHSAIRIFRQILNVDPSYDPARRDLTITLALTGSTEGALYHAERLSRSTTDDRLRANLEAYISQNSRGKPRGVALRFSLLPSTNANRGTSEEEIIIGNLPFKLDEASMAQAGIGLSTGATAWNRWTLGKDWSATLSASVDARIYDTASLNDYRAGARLDFAEIRPRRRISFGPQAELAFKSDQRYRNRLGFSVSGDWVLTPGRELGASLVIFRQEYPSEDYRNGTASSAVVGYRHTLSATTNLSASVTLDKENTRRDHLDHTDVGIVLGIEHELQNGLLGSLWAGYKNADYLGKFPGTTLPRNDQITTVGLTVRHAKVNFGGYSPELSYTFTRSTSNIALFDYDSHDVGLSLSKRF